MTFPDSSSNTQREYAASIAHLYRVFAHRRHGNRGWVDIDFPPEKYDLPEKGDVRSLAREDYDHLAWHAFCFDGDHPPTVQYFIARLLEEWEVFPEQIGLPSDETRHAPPVEMEMLVERMNRCRWREWSSEQTEAIICFFHRRLFVQIERPWANASCHPPTRTLEMIAFAQAPLQPLLSEWLRSANPHALLHLAQSIIEMTGKSRKGFDYESLLHAWDRVWSTGIPPAVIAELFSFFLSEPTATTIESRFFEATSQEEQTIYSTAITYIDALRNLRSSHQILRSS